MPSLATASPAKRAAPSLKTGRSASPNTFARRIYHTPIGRVGSDAQRARLDFTQRQMLRSGAVVRVRHLMRLDVHTHKATGAVTPAALASTKETHPEPERGAHTVMATHLMLATPYGGTGSCHASASAQPCPLSAHVGSSHSSTLKFLSPSEQQSPRFHSRTCHATCMPRPAPPRPLTSRLPYGSKPRHGSEAEPRTAATPCRSAG